MAPRYTGSNNMINTISSIVKMVHTLKDIQLDLKLYIQHFGFLMKSADWRPPFS